MKSFRLTLRIKILSGFLILSLMLLIAGAWSIREFTSIGASVQKILDDNYSSINAARMMRNAMEREEQGFFLILSGRWEEGAAMIAMADRLFQQGYTTALMHVTLPGEQEHMEAIQRSYLTYQNRINKPVAGTVHQGDLDWYLRNVRAISVETKTAIEKLMELNARAMYTTSSDLKNRAHRATMPGIVAIISAFLFAIIFNYLINYYVVNPIIMIRRNIDDFLRSGQKRHVRIEGVEELTELAASIENLEARARN